MNAVKDHISAVQLTMDQLSKGKTWLYLLPALLVSLIFYWIFSFFNGLSESAGTLESIPLIGTYMASGVQSTIGLMVWMTDLFFKFFILSLLSPVNCMLSEKTDNDLTGARFDGGIARIITDLLRAFVLLIALLFLNLVAIWAWSIVAWITGFHFLDSIIYFLIGAFFLGFSFYDYSLERYGVGFSGTIGFGFQKVSYMLAAGTIFSLIYMIPYLGLLLAPFLVTILSTAVYLEMSHKIPNKQITNSIQR